MRDEMRVMSRDAPAAAGLRRGASYLRRRYAPHNSRPPTPNPQLPHGISLIEVLISMFVLLFGLMGVAALFPVGNYYVTQGEKYVRGTGLAQNAFDEVNSRIVLRPEWWHYAEVVSGPPNDNFIIHPDDASDSNPQKTAGYFNMPLEQDLSTYPATNPIGDEPYDLGQGHAFVIDPMGTAAGTELNLPDLDIFPYNVDPTSGTVVVKNPWDGTNNLPFLSGERWPLRRLTILDANGLMTTTVAETIFRLRDDLAVEKPKEDGRPSIQLWRTDAAGNLLSREYHGNYSWLATVVPTSSEALAGLQPANIGHQTYYYDVSVVVFHKRDEVPTDESERLIEAELHLGGELEIFSTATNGGEVVDKAVDGIKSGNWIAVTGVNQVTGVFMMKWYRLLSLDQETTTVGSKSSRYAMLAGPDWPSGGAKIVTDLRAVILPGVISVATHQMQME